MKDYKYFTTDAYTYNTMHEKTLEEMNRVKDKKDDEQRTLVQVDIPKHLFDCLNSYSFFIENTLWTNAKERFKNVILDSYDFIVSSPLEASLKNVITDNRLEETISLYLENSPKTKIRAEIPPTKKSKVSVYLSLPTLLAYKLKFSSLMSGVYISDIITYILGYLIPKLVVRKYAEIDDGTALATNYSLIYKMRTEIFKFSNHKLKKDLNLLLSDVIDDEFVEIFESHIDELIIEY
ncbi:hypothetical protein J6R97_00170 [bacterium]|nr:hypothetical protein [bacterium]